MSLDTLAVVCGILSTVLAVLAGLPYLRSILQGRTKPHQFSFLIFAVMNGIVFLSQFLEGGRSSVLISLTFFIYCVIIFTLSLTRGSRDTSRYDRLLLGLSLLIIVFWVVTRSNELAIWLTVLIDVFATTMIVLKVAADPHSEAPFPWVLGAIAYVFSCLSLVGTSVGILYVRPVYGVFSELVVAAAVYIGLSAHRRRRRASTAPTAGSPFV